MRKTVIALIIVLPMIFVLVVFSSLNIVSISVPVSVSGIRIYADEEILAEGEALYVDMADNNTNHTIRAKVEPDNASEQGYILECDNENVLTVDKEGKLKAVGEGTATVKATSKDKGFTASVPVVVTSSKAYGVTFSLYDSDGNNVPLTNINSTYTASGLKVGNYSYKVNVIGGDSSEYTLESDDKYQAIVNEGSESIMLPFSGRTSLTLTVDDAFVNGMTGRPLTRTINLNVDKVSSDTGIVVNGVADGNTVLLANGATQTTMYVECRGEPQLTGRGIIEVKCRHQLDNAPRAVADEHHILYVTLEENFEGEDVEATLSANGRDVPVRLRFSEFDFKLRSAVIEETNADAYSSVILKDTSTVFYAVPAVDLQDVEYEWTTSDGLSLDYSETSGKCSFCAEQSTSQGRPYTVTVKAKRKINDNEYKYIGVAKTLTVTVTTKINSIWINNKVNVDLAERYTVGGKKYDVNGNLVDNNDYSIDITVTKKGETLPVKNDFEGIDFIVESDSGQAIAEVQPVNGKQYLVIKGTGAITVTVRWQYNEVFGGNATQSIKLNVVEDAVQVGNYADLRKATDEGRKVVLTDNIMLGSQADNKTALSPEVRQEIIAEHKYRSTYNTEFYKYDKNHTPDQVYVQYAMEFKADVYGNGFNLDAEYFTNAVDAAGTPTIFRGPLVFVEYKAVAAVAGQDNIAFLIRTDGVKLYGVNLLGCSDESLYEYDKNGNATYQLNKLNKLGTTLEINADCEIINCRIRNGRNVVRVYGGNSEGLSYFVQAIPSVDVDAHDQIKVTIDGCVITQGREFLVKVGANKALQANNRNGQEPVLRDERGNAYSEKSKSVGGKTYYTNNYDLGEVDEDSFFYKRYVMTDLTLRDTVLETSGLFCVGVESNFSGALLYEGVAKMTGDIAAYAKITESWRHSGATSFASILRLEGDVRTYDWKDIANVDSSTLIEPVGDGALSELMKFDVSAMLREVDGDPDYAKLLYKTSDGNTFVHGGIAFYGGGRNYSQLILDLDDGLADMEHLSINIAQFAASEDNAIVSRQAQLLPYAAGTHDFNFWLYSANGANNYDKQLSDGSNGVKYSGVAAKPLFGN